mmetsp:Transcript_9467/g.27357  ORF Transcript_9467/g.27357 Transcript_9467/m.27357 type:complete len:808 (-) Transcript_9467:70-2493(-)
MVGCMAPEAAKQKGASRDMVMEIKDDARAPLLGGGGAEVDPDLENPPEQATVEPISLHAPIVQFSAIEIIAGEEEKTAHIEVIRIGNLTCEAEVTFKTVNGTAMAGVVYEETNGVLKFEPGEDSKTIVVPLIDDDTWRTTTDFYIQLPPDGVRGVELGQGMDMAKIVVIDNDTFPTNKYTQEISAALDRPGDLQTIHIQVSDIGLMFEFFRFLWQMPMVRRDSIKWLMVDFCHSLNLALKLLINMILVDFILKKSAEADARAITLDLLGVAAATVVPFAFLHYLDWCKTFMKIRGPARTHLQESLVNRFLDVESSARSQVNHGGIIMAITRDAPTVIENGYMQIFALVHSLTNILMLWGYQFIAGFVFHKKVNPVCVIPLLCYPAALLVFVRLRASTTTSSLNDMRRQQDKFVERVDLLVQNLELVKAYSESEFFLQKVRSGVAEFNKAAGETARVLLNNARFPQWLTVIAVGLYTFLGGWQVVRQEISLGSFLVSIRIFYSAGKDFGATYASVLSMQSCVPNLHRIVVLQNLKLEVVSRRPFANFRSKEGKTLRKQLTTAGLAEAACDSVELTNWSVPVVDLLPLKVYVGHGESDFIEIQQGKIVYLVGPHGGGKSQLLRFLALSDLPENVDRGVYVPSHLKVLHLTADPLFFFGTLKQNLLLGGAMERGCSDEQLQGICKRVGLPSKVRSLVSEDKQEDWNSSLSMTHRHLLSLARALIANPDLLCIGKYLQQFDTFTTKKLLSVFRDYVNERGLCQDPEQKHRRRPRTVIIAANTFLDPDVADQIFHVTAKKGVEVMKPKVEDC